MGRFRGFVDHWVERQDHRYRDAKEHHLQARAGIRFDCCGQDRRLLVFVSLDGHAHIPINAPSSSIQHIFFLVTSLSRWPPPPCRPRQPGGIRQAHLRAFSQHLQLGHQGIPPARPFPFQPPSIPALHALGRSNLSCFAGAGHHPRGSVGPHRDQRPVRPPPPPLLRLLSPPPASPVVRF
jgi:hypothetical protein